MSQPRFLETERQPPTESFIEEVRKPPVALTEGRTRRVSVRLLWPFARVAGSDPAELDILEREGIGHATFADPDARVGHSAAMQLLEHAVERTGDAGLGLRAAENLEAGDLDVVEHVTRTCPDLRTAILCAARYVSLLTEAAEITLEEGPELATASWSMAEGVAQNAAANDFITASALKLLRRQTGVERLAVEIHLAHEHATDAGEYARVFGAKVRLGMPRNAIVMRRSALDLPLLRANRALHAAFELHARALLERVRRERGASVHAREIVLAQLADGDTNMETVARKMAMSVATLRRRLAEEGTSHREILDDARYQLAVRYLRDRRLATREVAFRLGFSHVTALHKAFKRWSGGVTPAEFRSLSLVRRTPREPLASTGS
jgi:AraC-like DNA-binding protein